MVTFLYLKDVWFNSNNSCVSQLESLTTLRHAKSDWAKKRKCNTITRTVNGRCFVDSLKNVSPAIRKLKDELQVILWPLSGGGVLWSLMNDRSFALPGCGLHVSCFLLRFRSSDLMLMLRFSALSWQNSSGWWWAVEDLRNTLPALILFIIFSFVLFISSCPSIHVILPPTSLCFLFLWNLCFISKVPFLSDVKKPFHLIIQPRRYNWQQHSPDDSTCFIFVYEPVSLVVISIFFVFHVDGYDNVTCYIE